MKFTNELRHEKTCFMLHHNLFITPFFGVQAIFLVSYPNHVISGVKCTAYIGKEVLNSHDLRSIQKHVITTHVMKRFRCICEQQRCRSASAQSDQHLCSRGLDRILLLAISKFQDKLATVVKHASLSLTWWVTSEDRFSHNVAQISLGKFHRAFFIIWVLWPFKIISLILSRDNR